ncbi:helix-turn-helix domain-containing protein [Couchioplanes caeruleus]|uniref:helix-turn-helix domain-containing protein n=1 Tax=Couchioplanes caeruleus TaxID=56438 RepID=UPI001B806B79|nr:helix-turn-helix domain-containing protein [Couchioplanes caeruleus]
MSVDSIQDLAELLQRLKARTGRSYDALARRANLSRSSVHRYCSGAAVPADFESLSRLARACGANREELLELHRRWALASAAPRETPATSTTDTPTAAGPPAATGGSLAATGTLVAAPAPAEEPASGDEAAEAAAPSARRMPRRYLVIALTLAFVGTMTTAAFAAKHWSREDGARGPSATRSAADGRLLFTPACADVVSMGQHDECVREVQRLLSQAGTTIGVDASFGPETLRRVTAFQVLADLPTKGVVDDATKEALYAGRVSLKTWSPAQVERRVREVFHEEPDLAVRIARCQSYLDPHWITPNTNGTRNWGVFQLADVVLDRYQGTPRMAFDPEWNIRTAHRLWADKQGFSNWPACLKAALPT